MVAFHCTGFQQRRIRCTWGGSLCRMNQDQEIYDSDGYRVLDHQQHFCNQKDVRSKFCPSFQDGEALKWSRTSGNEYNVAGRIFQYVLMHAE